MKKITLILLSLSLFANVALAQILKQKPNNKTYFSAELVFTNGDVKQGLARVPNSWSQEIQFKNAPEDEPTDINSDELFTITFQIENLGTHTLERCSCQGNYTKKSGEVVVMDYRGTSWLYRYSSHEKMNFYFAAYEYYVDKKGKFFNIRNAGKLGMSGIQYYMRRPSEKKCMYITETLTGITLFHQLGFRNAAATYLSDNEALVKRIKNKEFKSKNVLDVYYTYISD